MFLMAIKKTYGILLDYTNFFNNYFILSFMEVI